jgi:hypothetical protein
MIKEKTLEVKGHSRNIKYYSSKGYDIKVGKVIEVKIEDLSKGTTFKVSCLCDKCEAETIKEFREYYNYTKGLTESYYCKKCKSIKSEKTNLSKYGVKNPMQNQEIKDKLKNSLMDKYGVDHYSKTEEYKTKFKQTSIKNWGVDNPSKNADIVNKISKKNTNRIKSESFRKESKNTKQRNTWMRYAEKLPSGYNALGYSDNVFKIKHDKCGNEFDITKFLLYNRQRSETIICLKCNPITIYRSSFEVEIGEYLNTLGVQYEQRNRSILNGQELDYLIPEHNIAIECNGLYWHSEAFKSKSYHKNKTMMCQEKGITLLHIWEDDWANKREIIKSVIKYKLGIIDSKIWARKCDIRNVDTKEYKDFLNNNHIQGYAPSSINIGLYHNEELVSLMTFGWRRTNNKREYELIRFCNKIGTTVIGGASRLFKYFINNNEVEEIISYADISLFEGGLYKSLGFEKVNVSDPNYFWVVDGVKRHRYNYSKRKLVNQGYDSNKTEVEIMNDRGYYRIFSTGQEKYSYK